MFKIPKQEYTGEFKELAVKRVKILASGLVYALAPGLGTFTFGDPRTATLKGLDGSFDLRPVLG